ncbi:hypothetical protein PMI04_007850 [Sphingobium sp. AP49]|uniref:hypothetical protein n=1 Tax=Sphingobium sp. AP49 TaxID=1144307 RepID=UPI00026EDDAC|nr:hypothetical protein [Sphingobium sp. AP49]WHO40499.1 hypothetical protein PMI04_007850 [Sphingobium sp. AP49]
MLAGEALGAGVIGDVRSGPVRWAGPWGAGVRPEQAARVRRGTDIIRPERDEGSRIR